MNKLNQIIEILHTIFCRRPHENDLCLYETSEKCCYYIEKSIEDTLTLKAHREWAIQAEVFIKLSNGNPVVVLEHMMQIYRSAQAVKEINPLLLKYVESLIGGD